MVVMAAVGYGISEQLEDSRDDEIRQVALQRARLANEFGAALPILTARKLEEGLTGRELRSIEVAVRRAQESQPLLGVVIFNRRRQLVYPSVGHISFEVPAGIDNALRGSPTVERLTYGDPVIEASVPIHDVDGTVIGAFVLSLDEDRLRAVVGQERRRIFATLVGAAVLLWLLLLPASVRLARLVAPSLSLARWRAVRRVRHALSAGGLEVHYQPKVAVASGAPCGAEGLVRCRSKGRLIPPGEFLPHVARSDLLHQVTASVLDQAVADAAAWRREGHALGVAVNLAPESFGDADLPARVEATLKQHGLAPDALTLEVTETAMFRNTDRVESSLRELAQLGVSVSIDDFGTGHSSLARLHRFPISEVKIDRSFVCRMTSDERPFVDSMITLAHALGIEVVAEGVEDLATLELLAKSDCDTAQGFFFCRPLPVDEFREWLAKPHAADVAALEALGVDGEAARVAELVETARRLAGGEVAWLGHFTHGDHVFETVRGDRRFFNAQEGEGVPLATSYCARMVAGEIPNVVDDTRRHPITRELGATAEANIGSYVGVPVRLPDGELYGSLCSASHERAAHPPETVRLLAVLATLIGQRVATTPAGPRGR